MQNLCNIKGLHPRRPVRRHLIGTECVNSPIQETDGEKLLKLELCSEIWWFTLLEWTSSSTSSPVVVINCSLLLPDFFLEKAGRWCLLGESHWFGWREGPSGSCVEFERAWELCWANAWLSFWCDDKTDLNFSCNPRTVSFKKWIIRNSTCRSDSPAGAVKSGWNRSIQPWTSGVYISERRQPSQLPWLISVRASEDWIWSSGKFTSWSKETQDSKISYMRFWNINNPFLTGSDAIKGREIQRHMEFNATTTSYKYVQTHLCLYIYHLSVWFMRSHTLLI